MYPEQHPRRYVLDEAHLVVPIPAPTPDQLSLPDREVDEDGVVWTFVLVPTPYHPVVTVMEETPALIYSHFGVTGEFLVYCLVRFSYPNKSRNRSYVYLSQPMNLTVSVDQVVVAIMTFV